MDNSSSQNKLSATQAQKMMLSVLEKARAQIDIAASAKHTSRDRTRALRRLDRALAALADPKK